MAFLFAQGAKCTGSFALKFSLREQPSKLRARIRCSPLTAVWLDGMCQLLLSKTLVPMGYIGYIYTHTLIYICDIGEDVYVGYRMYIYRI